MRTFVVSHSRDGFKLRLVDRSRVRDTVAETAERVCALTGHHLCNSGLLMVPLDWAERAEKVLLEVPIDRAAADALAFSADDWSYLDDEEPAA